MNQPRQEPMTDLTRVLLHSIPKKVYLWLRGLGVVREGAASQGEHALGELSVRWAFGDGAGEVGLYRGGEPCLTVLWDMDLVSPAGARPGQPLGRPLEDDLGWFVGVERDIYQVIQDLDDKVRAGQRQCR